MGQLYRGWGGDGDGISGDVDGDGDKILKVVGMGIISMGTVRMGTKVVPVLLSIVHELEVDLLSQRQPVKLPLYLSIVLMMLVYICCRWP